MVICNSQLSQLKIKFLCILKFYLTALDNPDEHTEESNMLKLKLVHQSVKDLLLKKILIHDGPDQF